MSRLILPAVLLLCCALLINDETCAQNTKREVSDNGVSFGNHRTAKWRVGVIVKATKGPMKGAIATVPVPIEWPEQSLKIAERDVSRGVKYGYRDLGAAKQLLVRMPRIRNGESAKAVFTYEITRKEIIEPKDPSAFEIPKRIPRDLKRWLNSSPYIDSRDSKIRSLAREAAKEKAYAWEKVEAIYDLARERVEYKEGDIKSATQALRDGYGDCEELTSLFIAMCRAIKVPARMVWVPDHCYPEFYLADENGEGHWFPCQAAGTRAFGSMPEMRPILQKGDNFKVPEKSKPQRYISEYVEADPVRGSGRPEVTFIFEYSQPEG